ncbi:MAG: YfhO family protein [Caldilineaceae bacterium]
MWFGPVLFPALTGRTLLPYDNLYSFEPWRSLQPGLIPHNNLLSDLVLGKRGLELHINRTFAEGQLPLWNPAVPSPGCPFWPPARPAPFTHSASSFTSCRCEAAYGWFTALQIGLAGINMYLLARTLRLRPTSALLSGVVFMFSGFLIVSVVFTMFIAAAVWLPLLLALIELIIRKQEAKGTQSFRPIPYIIAGAAIIGVMILAGHPELIYYTLLVAGVYAAARLVAARKKIYDLRFTIYDSSTISSGIEELSSESAIASSHTPPVTRSPGHPVTLSPGHLVTLSPIPPPPA